MCEQRSKYFRARLRLINIGSSMKAVAVSMLRSGYVGLTDVGFVIRLVVVLFFILDYIPRYVSCSITCHGVVNAKSKVQGTGTGTAALYS